MRDREQKGIIDGQRPWHNEGVRIADPSGKATGARHGQESFDGIIALCLRIVELRAVALERRHPLVHIVRDVHHNGGRQLLRKQVIKHGRHGVGLSLEGERPEMREIDPMGD